MKQTKLSQRAASVQKNTARMRVENRTTFNTLHQGRLIPLAEESLSPCFVHHLSVRPSSLELVSSNRGFACARHSEPRSSGDWA